MARTSHWLPQLSRCIGPVLVGLLVSIHSGPKALADSSGIGSVVGDNIEAEVSFDQPPTTTTGVSCDWRPALDITAGAKPGTVAISVQTSSGVTESLYLRVCGGVPDTYYWIRNDVGIRVATVAKSRVSRLLPPLIFRTAPSPGRVIVNSPTWFWVPRSLWRPISVTAHVPTPAGPISVTTTATPRTLVFTPGDGHRTVTCRGPGTPWTMTAGDGTQSRCSYSYRSSSRPWSTRTYSARTAIRWDVRWQSSLGARGSLPSITTGMGTAVTVTELQALSR